METKRAFPPRSATTIRHWRPGVPLAALAFVALATLYFALTARAGIISTNDGSHYALTRALAEHQTARIDTYVNYTAIQPPTGTPTPADYRDVSAYNGHFYSDRPPGTVLLAVPFYWLGTLAGRVSGRGDLDFPRLFTLMLPPLLGALTALALYGLARGIGASVPASAVTALTGALTTLLLKYATLLYSHIAAAFCVTAALALLFAAERVSTPRRPALLASAGFVLGYGALVEYPNALLIVPVSGYLLWRARGVCWSTRWRLPRPLLLAWTLPVLALLAYNWIVFGRPWHSSYTYQYYFVWARSLPTTYVTPPVTGLRWLLFGPAGLFVVTPALALALWGLLLLARRDVASRARALLLAAVVLSVLLPTALHRTFYGGGSQDTRYLLAIVPALYAPLAVWLDAVTRLRHQLLRWVAYTGLTVSALWGLARSYLSLFTMFGHPAAERPLDVAVALLQRHWRELAYVAPNLELTHYLLIWLVPLALAIVLASRRLRVLSAEC